MKHLLLLHGALGSKEQFNDLKNSLEKKFQVHTLNFSGHGGSPVDDVRYSIELFCDDVISYIEKLNITEVNIFGYSMGGYVAISLASRKPELVRNIFTLATKFDWSPEQALKETQMLNPEQTEQKVPAFADELKSRHAPSNWKTVMQKTSEMMIHLGNHSLSEVDFKKVNCPVRISVGDRDKMVSVESSYTVSQLFSKGSFLVLPNTPHPFEMVDVKRLVWELENFLL